MFSCAASLLVMSSTTVCWRCNAKVLNGLKCRDCDNHFHPSCAKLTKNVVITEDNVLICCEIRNNISEDVVLCEALTDIADNGKIDVSLVKLLLNQKDIIIGELRERINLLNEHVTLLKDCVNFSTSNSIQPIPPKKVNVSSRPVNKLNSDNNVNILNRKVNSNVKTDGVNVVSTPINDSINDKSGEVNVVSAPINDDSNGSSAKAVANDLQSELWSNVVRKKEKRTVVVGKKVGAEASSLKIRGVPRIVSLHVYRLSPETELENVLDFLKPRFKEVTGEKLVSRNPDLYSSFKINLYEEHVIAAFDPNLWPENARVRRFFHQPQKLNTG